jgi:hypothetical protein
MGGAGWVRAGLSPSRVIVPVEKRLSADSIGSPAVQCAMGIRYERCRLDSSNGTTPRARGRQVRPCSRTRFSFTAISERLGEQGTFALIQPIYKLMAGAVNEQVGSVKDCGPFATCKAFFGFLPNLSIFFEPERRNSRKSTFLYLHVSQILSKTR